MAREYNFGFLIFDKSWFYDNAFFDSLSHAEFKIIIFILSCRLKVTKKMSRYRRGELLFGLYHHNNILAANVSTRTIAEKCRVSRATVCRALAKFHEAGAVIRISHGGEEGENNLFILGFKGPISEGEDDYFFVDSMPLRTVGTMPQKLRDYIVKNFKERIFSDSSLGWRELFGVKGGSINEQGWPQG